MILISKTHAAHTQTNHKSKHKSQTQITKSNHKPNHNSQNQCIAKHSVQNSVHAYYDSTDAYLLMMSLREMSSLLYDTGLFLYKIIPSIHNSMDMDVREPKAMIMTKFDE